MELIYTDDSFYELGVLKDFTCDFDTTDTKDFEFSLDIKNNVLVNGGYWYIEGTEYAGRITGKTVDTEKGELRVFGQNMRGLLASKIVKPTIGQDYKVISGHVGDIVNGLLNDAGLLGLFVFESIPLVLRPTKIKRYTDLYNVIVSISNLYNLALSFYAKDGRFHIKIDAPADDSLDYEFNPQDIQFSITKHSKTCNHLICLGQGELKERQVVELFIDGFGQISDRQTFLGIDDITEVYDNPNCEDLKELQNDGANKLLELHYKDEFSVMSTDKHLTIGSIVAGYEEITDSHVSAVIENEIVDISDNEINIEYVTGEVNTMRDYSDSLIDKDNNAYTLSGDNVGNLYLYYPNGGDVPTFTKDADGNLWAEWLGWENKDVSFTIDENNDIFEVIS